MIRLLLASFAQIPGLAAMTHDKHHNRTLPPALANRLNPLCHRFEQEWLAGRTPRLEEFLSSVEQADRAALLAELLALELHHRAHRGERVSQEEYRRRLPGHAWIIEEMIPSGGLQSVRGLRVGRYEIEEEIACGGMAEVWRARDWELGRPLAIKLLQEHFRGQPELERRFREEAAVALSPGCWYNAAIACTTLGGSTHAPYWDLLQPV
jgi:hypothetical protein